VPSACRAVHEFHSSQASAAAVSQLSQLFSSITIQAEQVIPCTAQPIAQHSTRTASAAPGHLCAQAGPAGVHEHLCRHSSHATGPPCHSVLQHHLHTPSCWMLICIRLPHCAAQLPTAPDAACTTLLLRRPSQPRDHMARPQQQLPGHSTRKHSTPGSTLAAARACLGSRVLPGSLWGSTQMTP
jgi:hypothetical protein